MQSKKSVQNKKAIDAARAEWCLSRAERKARVAAEGIERTTLSFYRYVQIADPALMRDTLHQKLSALGCLGRIYVAHEGINAQMNVPSSNFEAFDTYLQSLPEFAGIPYKIAVEEKDKPSFYKLTIKVKDKIVADGISDPAFDSSDTGAYLTPEEFNQYVDDPDAVVVDMRNGYESEVGKFENAITPDVDTFREELEVAPKLLRVHKNKKIALYCTGGIRCEKASAWLKHNGFYDVRHLKGGIIDYAHAAQNGEVENKFHGKNFVFDERMGERVSDEVIATCHLCQEEKSDTHYHCQNQACHVLYIGCDGCQERLGGYCSRSCRLFDSMPAWYKKLRTKNNHQKNIPQFKKNVLRAR